MSTIHDLRVSLRDNMRKIQELEKCLSELRQEVHEKTLALANSERELSKRGDTLALKELIIRDKDAYIERLEANLLELNFKAATSLSTRSSLELPSAHTTTTIASKNVNKTTTSSMAPSSTSNNNNNNSSSGTTTVEFVVSGETEQQNNTVTSSHQHTLKSKRVAISAESATTRYNTVKDARIELVKHDKSKRTKELLKASLFDNDFMKNLEVDQIDNIVDCMYSVEFAEGSLIIKEGHVGNIVYIVEGKSPVRSLLLSSFSISVVKLVHGDNRWRAGDQQRQQGGVRDRSRQGVRRAGHPLQLHAHRLGERAQRLQALGHRSHHFSGHHDEVRPAKAQGLHGAHAKVKHFIIFASRNKIPLTSKIHFLKMSIFDEFSQFLFNCA